MEFLIVTDGDRVLCEECYNELFLEEDPGTHLYTTLDHGVCDSCGFGIDSDSD